MYACQYGKLEAVKELITYRPEESAQPAPENATCTANESEAKVEPAPTPAPELKPVPEPLSEPEPEEEDFEEEEDEDEDERFEREMESEITLRAKWTMDGADTLDRAIDRLNGFASYLARLKSEGWELSGPVEDDYGHARLHPSVANVNLKNKVAYYIFPPIYMLFTILFTILILLYVYIMLGR